MSTVYLPVPIYDNIVNLWGKWKNKEWSVIAKVGTIDNKMIITDFFIPEQKNSQTYTEMEDVQGALLSYLQTKEDFAKEIESINDWRCRIHSHNTMRPFWSGTDNDTRNELCTDVFYDKEKDLGWSLSIVIGVNKTFHATIDIYSNGIKESLDVEIEKIEMQIDDEDDIVVYDGEINALGEKYPSDVMSTITSKMIDNMKSKLMEQASYNKQASLWEQNGVTIKYNTDIEEELRSKEKPDVVVNQFNNFSKKNKKKHKTYNQQSYDSKKQSMFGGVVTSDIETDVEEDYLDADTPDITYYSHSELTYTFGIPYNNGNYYYQGSRGNYQDTIDKIAAVE